MFAAEYDNVHRLLKLRFSANVTTDEVKLCHQRIRELLAGEESGFRLLVDLSGLEKMDTDCWQHIKQSMTFHNERGVKEIVRVIPDSHKDIGFTIMSTFHYNHDVSISVCETLGEAKELLSL